MKRRIFCVAAATLLPLAACTSASDPGTPADGNGGGDEGQTYTVAQIRWEAGDIFFNGVAHGEEETVQMINEETGDTIELKTVAANDASEQLNGLQQLMTQGIDGVSLVPWRGESMVNIVAQLEEQGIPVVIHNMTVPESTAPFVSFDNVEAGKVAAEAILTGLDESRGDTWRDDGGAIVILRGDITASFDRDRFEGYMSVFGPLVEEYPNVEIVERGGLGYQGEPARGAVADAITSYGVDNILAVGSVDGTMAVGGAIPALTTAGAVVEAGQPNNVPVTSVDCSRPELDAITAGTLAHCSEQPALAEGELVMRLLYDMMSRGEAAPSEGLEQIDGWDQKPWGPVEVTQRDDIQGPWYRTHAYGIPEDAPADSPDAWANASGS